jgi:hypothetical protein
MDSVAHDLSDAQWSALQAAWAGCAYCGATGVPLQRDCVLALSRGGRYTLTNIAPACGSCNASKCNEEVTSWLRRKRLDERGFLVRQLEITSALLLQSVATPHGSGYIADAEDVARRVVILDEGAHGLADGMRGGIGAEQGGS